MNDLISDTATMTSLQIAEVAGKPHKQVLKAVRAMEPAWQKATGGVFFLSHYKDRAGRRQPMFRLTKTECLYAAARFNNEARARLLIRWGELERDSMPGGLQISQNLHQVLRLAADQAERAEAGQRQIEVLKTKALFADAVSASDSSCLIAELAKILQQNGVKMGQNRLFDWLRMNGYLCTKGEYHNLPTDRAQRLGLFEIRKIPIIKPDGTVKISRTTRVTGKGQIYFVNKLLSGTD